MQAAQDGIAARRRGEPRGPAPYLAGYEPRRSLVNPRDAWLAGYDGEDERLAGGVLGGEAPRSGDQMPGAIDAAEVQIWRKARAR